MIPLHDDNKALLTPSVNYGLIAANCAVFLLGALAIGSFTETNPAYGNWGLVPYELGNGESGVKAITSMFLHGDYLHLIGNMWMLFIFGDNVESRFGHKRYLAFYLLCGLAASVAQYLSDPDSMAVMIGASGAIAGVLGAYIALYPRKRILVYVVVIVWRFPAWMVLGAWFALEAWRALGGQDTGIAYWAHIGGFLAGAALSFVFRGPDPGAGENPDDPSRMARGRFKGPWGSG